MLESRQDKVGNYPRAHLFDKISYYMTKLVKGQNNQEASASQRLKYNERDKVSKIVHSNFVLGISDQGGKVHGVNPM